MASLHSFLYKEIESFKSNIAKIIIISSVAALIAYLSGEKPVIIFYASLLALLVNYIFETYESHKATPNIKINRSLRENGFTVEASTTEPLHLLVMEYFVYNKITNTQNHNTPSHGESSIKITGPNTSNSLNIFEMSVKDMNPLTKFRFGATLESNKQSNKKEIDRIVITYSWFYKGNRIVKEKWIDLNTNTETTPLKGVPTMFTMGEFDLEIVEKYREVASRVIMR